MLTNKNNINRNSLETPQKGISLKLFNVNDKNHKNSLDKSTKSSTYKGPYINKKKNCQGKLIVEDQLIYQGNFKDDLFDGYGEFESKDYNYYGFYSCGKKCRKRKEINLKKNVEYKGFFKDNKKMEMEKRKVLTVQYINEILRIIKKHGNRNFNFRWN